MFDINTIPVVERERIIKTLLKWGISTNQETGKIDYIEGTAIPEVTWVVEGLDGVDESILGIKPVAIPNRVGTHTITVEVTNKDFDVVVVPQEFQIKPIDLNPVKPDLVGLAEYSNPLSTIQFVNNNPNGTWKW